MNSKNALVAVRLTDGRFRVVVSTTLLSLTLDFTHEELQTIATQFSAICSRSVFNFNPTKETVDIEDEEARA